MMGLQKIKNDPIDDIIAYLVDPENATTKLTENQQEQLLYYEMADNLIMRYGPLHPTPSLLRPRINRLREQEGKEPLSVRTIYNYIYNAQKIFGSVRSIDKPYWRSVMMQKEFERYHKAINTGNHKAAKGASEEMRRWGGFHIDDANQVDKRDIGEKNQILIIPLADRTLQINLDETFSMPADELSKIQLALDQHNLQRMVDKLSEQATDAEHTTIDP